VHRVLKKHALNEDRDDDDCRAEYVLTFAEFLDAMADILREGDHLDSRMVQAIFSDMQEEIGDYVCIFWI
jgi:hypothetical protein